MIAFVANNGASTTFPAGLFDNGPVEFHLLDREAGPTTTQREIWPALSITRPQLPGHYSHPSGRIENYLHPDAIR